MTIHGSIEKLDRTLLGKAGRQAPGGGEPSRETIERLLGRGIVRSDMIHEPSAVKHGAV
jgi:hypothetical protein